MHSVVWQVDVRPVRNDNIDERLSAVWQLVYMTVGLYNHLTARAQWVQVIWPAMNGLYLSRNRNLDEV